MQFMVQFTLRPESRPRATSRLDKAGGPPPDGITMIGGWHSAIMGEGFNLVETDDIEALAGWCAQRADRSSFKIVPVLSDGQTVEAAQR